MYRQCGKGGEPNSSGARATDGQKGASTLGVMYPLPALRACSRAAHALAAARLCTALARQCYAMVLYSPRPQRHRTARHGGEQQQPPREAAGEGGGNCALLQRFWLQ